MWRFAGNIFNYLLIGAAFVVTTSCVDDDFKNGDTPKVRPLTAEEKFLIESSNNFAIDLLADSKDFKTPNIALSPVSAAMALGMIGNAGSPENFDLFKVKMGLPQLNNIEINKAFYEVSSMLPLIDKTVKVNFTNSIWTNYDLSINEDYYNNVMAYFNTDIREFREEKAIEKKLIDKWLLSQSGHFNLSLDSYNLQSNFKIINLSTLSGRMFDGIQSRWVKANFHGVNGKSTTTGMNLFLDVPVNASKTEEALTLEIPIGNSNYFLKVIVPQHPGQNINFTELNTSASFRTSSVLIPDIFTASEFPLHQKIEQFEAEKYLGNAFASGFNNRELQPQLSCVNMTQISLKGVKLNENTPDVFDSLNFDRELIQIDRPFYYLIKERNTELIVFEGRFFQVPD